MASKKINAIDISFTNEKGKEIEPKSEVTVKLTADMIDNNKLSVVHIDNDGYVSLVKNVKIDTENTSLTFKTDEFSTYALAEYSEEPLLDTTTRTTKAAPILRATGSAPATEKKLVSNGDGTYTLALSVTGSTSSSSSTQVTKANVILVVDTSNSMNNSSGTTAEYVYTEYNGTSNNPVKYGIDEDGNYFEVYYRNNNWRTSNNNYGTVYNGTVYTRSGGGSISRIEAEKDALTKDGGIIDNLLAQNVAGDPNKSDIIEVAIANFGTRGSTAQSFTTNSTTLKNTINGLTTSTGTNWEEGLMRAQELATSIKASQPDEAVYVIFLTDGEPTTHNNSYSVNTNYATEWGYASDNARALVTSGATFYGLFTWGSSNSSHYLSSLVQYAYTGSGNSNTALDSAYAQYFTDASDTETLIAALNQIVHDITVGVGYTNVELEDGVTSMTTSNISTTASGEITNMKYYRSGGDYSTTANNGLGEEWTNAPHAKVNDDGEVDWDLGNLVLENGVTYTMTFVVWPSQESLDLVADLNNGKVDYDSLTADQKSQISVSGGKYSLKTNTDYPTVTYSTVTTTTVDGETTTVVSDPMTTTITNPDPVGLAEQMLNAKKEWEDGLDPSQREEEVDSVELFLKLDGEYYYKDDKTGEKLGVTLTEASNWTETEYIAIAPGILITEDSPAYDPSLPHFTWDGTTYAMLEKGHEYVFEESDINNHFELTAYIHHPMIMGTDSDGNPIIKDVVFTKDSSGNITGIESVSDLTDTLSATNTLKGGINIYKKVVDADDEDVDTTDPFTITVHLTDAEGEALPNKTTADGQSYSIDYRIYYGENNPNYDENATQNRSDHIYVTGTDFDVTLYVGDVLRVVNVENGALYKVEERAVSPYELKGIEYKEAYNSANEADATTSTEKTDGYYEVKGNTAHYAVVTNKKSGFFYVYHSSDKTVEKISITDSRVNKNGQFNIVEETKEDYLYGGYFKAYSKAGKTDDELMAETYTSGDSGSYAYPNTDNPHPTTGDWYTDSAGTAYTGSAVSFKNANAYTDCGITMKPEVNTVYYLKEVPDQYFRPATYVVWDTRAENLDLKKLYMLTTTDDSLYKKTGLDGTIELDPSTKLYSTFKVTNDTGATETIKPSTVNSNLSRGFLVVWDANDKIVAGTYTMTPYFVTKDNVKVTSAVTRTVTVGEKLSKSDFTTSDEKVGSTYSEATE